MTDLEFMELALLRARDKKQFLITETPETERKLEDIIIYNVLDSIAKELSKINIDIKIGN